MKVLEAVLVAVMSGVMAFLMIYFTSVSEVFLKCCFVLFQICEGALDEGSRGSAGRCHERCNGLPYDIFYTRL